MQPNINTHNFLCSLDHSGTVPRLVTMNIIMAGVLLVVVAIALPRYREMDSRITVAVGAVVDNGIVDSLDVTVHKGVHWGLWSCH